jgi:hypothetical protein
MTIKLRALIATYFTYSGDLSPNRSGGPGGGGGEPIESMLTFNNY